MARKRPGILIALVVFVVVAAVIRLYSGPLYDMLVRMHGRPAGH